MVYQFVNGRKNSKKMVITLLIFFGNKSATNLEQMARSDEGDETKWIFFGNKSATNLKQMTRSGSVDIPPRVAVRAYRENNYIK